MKKAKETFGTKNFRINVDEIYRERKVGNVKSVDVAGYSIRICNKFPGIVLANLEISSEDLDKLLNR